MSLTLNIAALLKNTLTTGPGIRDTVWLQGCSIHCPGCANHAYLPHEPRVIMPIRQLVAHFKARKDKIDGCTISGGEPTEQAKAVGEFLCEIKKLGLSTVVYTGRTFYYLKRKKCYHKLLDHTDLLIDSPFIEQRKDDTLLWRGSDNQNLRLLSDFWQKKEINMIQPTSEIIFSDRRMVFSGV